jgi:hypothetical protein
VQSAASSFEVSLERAVRNLPFAHVVQDAESAAAQVPAMQSMHAVWPIKLLVDRPAAHPLHAPVPSVENEPLAQSNAEVAPDETKVLLSALPNSPEGTSSHAPCPSVEYEPSAQATS